MSSIIVTQVKSNRVVYFTDDPEYEPPMDGDWYYVSHYQGALPEGMTLRNCWRWRFNGGVFTDAKGPRKKSAEELLIENNRKALLQILHEKINSMRSPLLPRGSLGAVIRRKKLEQAQAYVNQPEMPGDYTLLQGVAHARDISLHEAALLVIDKASAEARILDESEIVRERFAQAVLSAKTEDELLELREYLMGEVFPALSAQFKFKVPHTRPIDIDKPVSPTHRVHEIARLKAQLCERINRARIDACSGFYRNEHLESRKSVLAKMYLQNEAGATAETDFALLKNYAEAHKLSLADAAQSILEKSARTERLMVETEFDKDTILNRIEALVSLRDIEDISIAIKGLAWDS